MWQPEPGWLPLSGGHGALTIGVWRADERWIVKRVQAPVPGSYFLEDPASPSYWRREAELALADLALGGVAAPTVRRVDEDEDGFTLWSGVRDRSLVPTTRVARALGELALSEVTPAFWHARGHVRAKVAQAEVHDGWPTLARTTVADLTEAVWSSRKSILTRLEAFRQVPSHGDLVQANILTIYEGKVMAIDWGGFGWSAAGEDLGMYALSAGCDLEPLVWQYTEVTGMPYDEVLWASRAVIAFTVIGRAEWALARVAPGEGALANKYRHPAVAPYLRALQTQLSVIEALLT